MKQVIITILIIIALSASWWWHEKNAKACAFAQGVQQAINGIEFDKSHFKFTKLWTPSKGDYRACWWAREKLNKAPK